jgi:hypothetical protein
MPKLSEVDTKPAGDVKPAKVTDAKQVQDYLKAKGLTTAQVSKEKWVSPEEIIESVVKLHGQTMENYRQGGLG